MPASGDCVFCAIVAGEASAVFVHEDPEHVAFMDKFPINPGHVLVVPRTHHPDALSMPEGEVGRLFTKAAWIGRAVKAAMEADGVNLGQNSGAAAGQIIFHVHVHVISRYDREGGRWPRRAPSDLVALEAVAARIRGALRRLPPPPRKGL